MQFVHFSYTKHLCAAPRIKHTAIASHFLSQRLFLSPSAMMPIVLNFKIIAFPVFLYLSICPLTTSAYFYVFSIFTSYKWNYIAYLHVPGYFSLNIVFISFVGV